MRKNSFHTYKTQEKGGLAWRMLYFLPALLFLSVLIFLTGAGNKAYALSPPPEYCTGYPMVSGWLNNFSSYATAQGWSTLSFSTANYKALLAPIGSTAPTIYLYVFDQRTTLTWNYLDTYTLDYAGTPSGGQYTSWRAATNDYGATWTSGTQTLNATAQANINMKGVSNTTSCFGGATDSITHTTAFSSDFYIYLPVNPGLTPPGWNFGTYACPAYEVGTVQPNCYAYPSSGGGGSGITQSDVFTALQNYFTPRVKEVIGLFIAMFTGVIIIQQFRWRYK